MFNKIVVVLFIVVLSTSVQAQLIDDVLIHQIEQSLLGGDYDNASTLIDKSYNDLEKSNENKLIAEKLQLERKSYNTLVEQFNALQRVDSNHMEKLITQYQNLVGHFNKNKVSLRAYENFKTFLSTSVTGDKKTALTHYLLAKHYSSIHTQSLKLDVLVKFECAKKATQNDQLEQARELVNSLKELTMHNSIFKGSQKIIPGIREEIILLERNLNEKETAANIHIKLYKQAEINNYTWAIFAGGSILNNGPIKDVVWEFQQVDEPFDVFTNTVSQLNSTFGVIPAIEVVRSFTNRFQLGLELEYGKIIHPILKLDEINYNVESKLEYKSAKVIGHFMFHNKVGLKPYMSLGYGYNDILRKEMPAPNVMLIGAEHFKVLEHSENFGQIIATFGSEYIPSVNSNAALRFYLSGFYNLKEQDLLSQFSYCLGIQIGLFR